MKTKIKTSIIAALAVTAVAAAGIGIATLSDTQSDFSQTIGFAGTYSLTAFAEEASLTGKTVDVNGTPIDVTTTKSVTSSDGEYKLYVTAIDTGDINVSSIGVGYTYNYNNYNGLDEGLSNVVYSSLTVRTSETENTTLSIDDMFASQISDFDGRAMLVIAEIPVAAEAADATITINANAIADFARDFTTENQDGAWKYGYVEYKWGTNEDFTFNAATGKNEGGDAWIATGVEIKAGWINAGSMTTIAYTASEAMDIKVDLDFVGSTDDTRLGLRVGVKNSEGTIYSNPAFYGMSSNTLSITQICSLNAGDTVYFIFSNEGKDSDGNLIEGAYPNGALSIGIYKLEAFADFANEFSLAENPNGAWTYGYVEYQWKDESLGITAEDFTFTTATGKNAGGDGWTANGVEIKAGWIDANSMTTIAYTASKDMDIKVALNFVGAVSEIDENVTANVSVRIGIKDSENKIYGDPDFLGAGKDIAVIKEYTLKAGDTIYFIFNNEASPIPNGTLSIKLYK